MNRIDEMFRGSDGKAVLIGFTTAGFPDGESSLRLAQGLLAHCDALELGIPFSDPVLDGPVIQESSLRALRAGFRPRDVFPLAQRLRELSDKPLLIMTYYNPVHRLGHAPFAAAAAAAGIDGVLIPDLPPEEMGDWKEVASQHGLHTVLFASMTTPPERLRYLGEMTGGFLYCFAVKGTTGLRDSLSRDLAPFLKRVRSCCSVPLAAGLGVSNPEQCREVAGMADGVVVGSALVKSALDAIAAGLDPAPAAAELAAELKRSLQRT